MKKYFLIVVIFFCAVNYSIAAFKLKSKNGKLNIGARLRFAYADRKYFNDINGFTKDRFYIHQARLIFEGKIYNKFNYEIGLETRGYDQGKLTKDAYAEYVYKPEISISFGQFKVPFSRKRMVSSAKMDLITRPKIADDFVPGRDIGVMVRCRTSNKKYVLYTGVFTGNGEDQKDDDIKGKPLYSVRAEFFPFKTFEKSEGDIKITGRPVLMIGINAVTTKDAPSLQLVEDNDYIRSITGKKQMYGGDITFKYKGIFFTYEITEAALNRDNKPKDHVEGFLYQLSYYIKKYKLQPVIQYDEFNPSKSTKYDTEKTLSYGINYLAKKNDIKILMNYYDRFKLKDTAVNPWKEDEIRIMIQLLID